MKSKISPMVILFLMSFALFANATGMNRVVLKQSDLKGSKGFLKQDMFYKFEKGTKIPYTNTIFVIQYDFDIAENITIPSGCALEFEGGCLKNGTINTNGCYIDAGLYQVFDNIKFNSINTYNNALEVIDNIYIKVLEANAFVNKKTNSIISANSIVNRRYTYKITGKSTTPSINERVVTVSINNQNYTIAEVTEGDKYKLKYDYSQLIAVDNATGKMVSGIVDSFKCITIYTISPLSYSWNSTVKNKDVHPEWFGAIGDNVNNDSYAYNTALDLAYYSDSRVIIGNGVYKLDDALVIHTHTNMVGVVPTVEYPVKGCFTVNTDVAMLVFDKYNPSGSFVLENFGFKPFSNKQNYNYVGIRVNHSQNHAKISNIGFLNPQKGIEIDAIGGVQMLRCEDISVWSDSNNGTIAVSSKNRLGGWFNANYFRFACVANSGGVKFEGGGNNILDGGADYIESATDYLIDLDNEATLIVKGGLYKETGHIARLRNSSRLIIEGDNYFIGEVDCDENSCVFYTTQNIQTRNSIINNEIVYNDIVLAHYKVFPKNTSLWHETIENTIVKPIETAANYTSSKYNGRLCTTGYCKIPMGNINIKGKTLVLRVISPNPFTASKRAYPFIINADVRGKTMAFSLASWLDNTSILYAPDEEVLGSIEKGERFVFIPSQENDYILNNFTSVGNSSFLISDIYIIDEHSKDIVGNKKNNVINILKGLESCGQEDGFLLGYNKGNSSERPTDLTSDDAGFEFFDTTLHKPIYWTGDSSIGDKGWVDALGRHPSQRETVE